MSDANQAALPISTVERETGLSKDVLRVWERRYGFPQPSRDANGDRVYPPEQVERLRLLKRLLDSGRRPGKIVPLSIAQLRGLLSAEAAPAAETGDQETLLELLREGEPVAVTRHLQQLLASQGLKRFVMETLPDTTTAVGEAWLRGDLSVFQEHFYTEVVQGIVRQALQALPTAPVRPRVLLTTLPGELHALGLLMVQAVLLMEGAEARSFGTQMPLTEIAAASRAQAADVVALSFSAAFTLSQAKEDLTALRVLLPAEVELWAGGAGVRGLRQPPEGVHILDPLSEVVAHLNRWRAQRLSVGAR